MTAPNRAAFLRRRNALWQLLRQQEPGTPAFEAALTELSALTQWDRARILAGLGVTEGESPSTASSTPVPAR